MICWTTDYRSLQYGFFLSLSFFEFHWWTRMLHKCITSRNTSWAASHEVMLNGLFWTSFELEVIHEANPCFHWRGEATCFTMKKLSHKMFSKTISASPTILEKVEAMPNKVYTLNSLSCSMFVVSRVYWRVVGGKGDTQWTHTSIYLELNKWQTNKKGETKATRHWSIATTYPLYKATHNCKMGLYNVSEGT